MEVNKQNEDKMVVGPVGCPWLLTAPAFYAYPPGPFRGGYHGLSRRYHSFLVVLEQ